MMLQHPIIQFPLIICPVVTYWRLKTNENFKLSERWSFIRGSKYSDFGILENWSLKRDGRLREVVASEGSNVLLRP